MAEAAARGRRSCWKCCELCTTVILYYQYCIATITLYNIIEAGLRGTLLLLRLLLLLLLLFCCPWSTRRRASVAEWQRQLHRVAGRVGNAVSCVLRSCITITSLYNIIEAGLRGTLLLLRLLLLFCCPWNTRRLHMQESGLVCQDPRHVRLSSHVIAPYTVHPAVF